MGLGGSLISSYTTLVLLSTASSTAASIWTVHIIEGPAPPPDKGPPFSANASRNPALIPYQIIGIVGAYIGSALIVGSLLLTVGRSLRKRAQRMAGEPTEMVKPITRNFERSPVSPGNNRHWYSPRRLKEMKSVGSSIRSTGSEQVSPDMDGAAAFDNNVLEADRRRRHLEMERLYAAVMAQDESRNPDPETVGAAVSTDMPPEYRERNTSFGGPPARNMPATAHANRETAAKSPIRAIYPPDRELPPCPTSPTSPIKGEYSQWTQPTYADPRSFHSRGQSSGSVQTPLPDTNHANTSSPKRLRKSIRNVKISGPIMLGHDDEDNENTPLSPRYYADPGTPPEPPTPGNNRNVGFAAAAPAMARENVDQIRGLPQASPPRVSEHQYANEAQLVTDISSTRRAGPHRFGAASIGTLPLREINQQYAQQAQTAQARNFPLSPGHWNATSPSRAYATSAGPMKTTFLEARRDKFSGPRTGVPTPYSPYMPFTPLTPVTPHLTSKAERKQREKEDKKFKKPIMEEDAVADEKDLWSSGY